MVPPIKVLVLVLELVLVLGATMCTQRSESRCSLAHLSQDREVEGDMCSRVRLCHESSSL